MELCSRFSVCVCLSVQQGDDLRCRKVRREQDERLQSQVELSGNAAKVKKKISRAPLEQSFLFYLLKVPKVWSKRPVLVIKNGWKLSQGLLDRYPLLSCT